MTAKLILQDGSVFEGDSFGDAKSVAGEVVFSTGMVGYPESFTDPSYKGQILICTYPLIGNYGVPDPAYWESDHVQITGLVVSNYIDTPSHTQSKRTVAQWLKDEHIPGIEIKDTRLLTQKLRSHGTMLGKIIFHSSDEKDIPFYDPNIQNLVAEVSTKKIIIQKSEFDIKKKKTILLIDCGAKRNIQKELLKRRVDVITVPWNFNPTDPIEFNSAGIIENHPKGVNVTFDAVVISNGPGDPKLARSTIHTIQRLLEQNIPILGVCLGHQLLALAAGGDTYKLTFGHRSQNQPCTMENSQRCYITTQNHGFAVGKIPHGFKPWFVNANDNSNEGIIHTEKPIMSVQFHPEATPGPQDTEWIFDYFLEKISSYNI